MTLTGSHEYNVRDNESGTGPTSRATSYRVTTAGVIVLLAVDIRARTVGAYVDSLDVSALYSKILAVEGKAGLQQQKEKKRKGTGSKARCRTTDPEARKMKMGDGGFAGSEEITKLERRGSHVYAPIFGEEKLCKAGSDSFPRQLKDSDESFAFRH